MYAETELMFPHLHSFSLDVQQFEEFGWSFKPNASLAQSSVIQAYAVPDYNLWGAPIIEEPVMDLNPIADGISLISCGEDVMSSQSLSVSDIESSIEKGQLLNEVFYECRKDILAKEGNETPLSEGLSINIPVVNTEENGLPEGPILTSVSSGCQRSMDYANDPLLRPNFLDFPVMDFDAIYGMRRAFSDGDIKTLNNGNGNGNLSYIQSPIAQPCTINTTISQHRREQLSRYWSKKSKRNFGRKIKYACRKALADNQPRIRGRFAKTEETEVPKKA